MSVTTLSSDNMLLLLNLTDGCFTGMTDEGDSFEADEGDNSDRGRQLMRVTTLSDNMLLLMTVFMLLLSNLTDECFTGDDTDGIYVAVVQSH